MWLKKRVRNLPAIWQLYDRINALDVKTVCREAQCPNVDECFGQGTATFLILGDICTRNCLFCAVKSGRPEAIDLHEPYRVAAAAAMLNLQHVVITSVTRDDLPDGGASVYFNTVKEVRLRLRDATIELLIPDLRGNIESLIRIIDAKPQVLAHNIETVNRLYSLVRPGAIYQRSLKLLNAAKQLDSNIMTKSGFMVGLGETKAEIFDLLRNLKLVDCDIVTIGQYLRPGPDYLPVSEYVSPEDFKVYSEYANSIDIHVVASGPYIRSSYCAGDLYKKASTLGGY